MTLYIGVRMNNTTTYSNYQENNKNIFRWVFMKWREVLPIKDSRWSGI